MQAETAGGELRQAGPVGLVALAIGVVGLAASLVGLVVNADQFAHSYLAGFVFWLTIGLGSLFFVMVHHLVKAQWSVVLRRVAEAGAMTLPVLAVLFVPLLVLLFAGKLHTLYVWSDPAVVAGDHLLEWKRPWLNSPFFGLRAVLYFGIWCGLAWLLYRASRRQDTEGHSDRLAGTLQRISAPGMLLFALSLTFASFDWVMSIAPKWYSTIFGVYLFSLSALGVYAFLILCAAFLQRQGALRREVTVEHYHDLGKWLFAFTVFYAYIAFSQFILIWSGNLPEETEWYIHRWQGSWQGVTWLLVVGHFFVPFLALIGRSPKRHVPFLAVMAGWVLLMNAVELHWLILPNLHHHGVAPSWQDVAALVGIGGIVVWRLWANLAAAPLVPLRDPRLEQSIAFVNA